jgi:MFS family permease
MRSLWLLSIAHALNHGQAVLLPLIYLQVIDEFHVGVGEIAFVAAASAVASGLVQAGYAFMTRRMARRPILTGGQLLFGLGFASLVAVPSFGAFAATTIVSRIGGSSPSSSRRSAAASPSAPTFPAATSDPWSQPSRARPCSSRSAGAGPRCCSASRPR